LIQADFVLAASREAVPDSEWNQALLTGVCELFVDAVQQLCADKHRLAFEWMQYWPQQNMEGIWDNLRPTLEDGLASAPVLFTRKKRLGSIARLRSIPNWFLHDGSPLVPDTTADVYLSKKYTKTAVQTLRSLGLAQLSNIMMVERVQADLDSIHKRPLDDAWHDTFAEVLQRLRQDSESRVAVHDLDVIPLDDGRWVSPNSVDRKRIYLPLVIDEDAVKIPMPKGLGFLLLHPTAAAVGGRLAFYGTLGVCSCDPGNAIRTVIETHKSSRPGELSDYLGDFEILFWYGQRFDPKHNIGYAAHFKRERSAYCQDSKVRKTQRVLMPSDEVGDAASMLSQISRTDYEHRYGFLHDAYLSSRVRDHIRHGMNWKSWLRKCGISTYPPLVEKPLFETPRLNILLRLASRDHSEMFLECMRKHWSTDYHSHFHTILPELEQISVQCMNGERSPLKRSLLPTEQLLTASSSLHLPDRMPFLKMSPTSQNPAPSDWGFLRDLGVTCELTYEFYLIALQVLADDGLLDSHDLVGKAAAIYRGIGESATLGDSAAIRVSLTLSTDAHLTTD
jgi:hypothetical protein